MIHMPLLLALALLGAVLLSACGSDSPDSDPTAEAESNPTPAPPPPPPPTEEELKTIWHGEGNAIVVKVDDLHCAGCEASVKGAVGAIQGVDSVEADHLTDLVRIRIADPSRRLALIPEIEGAIQDTGKEAVASDPAAAGE